MTTALALALRELHRSETTLSRQLRSLAARHHVEHEIHHVALDIAAWSDEHARDLAIAADRYHLTLNKSRLTTAPHTLTTMVDAVQKRVSIATGRLQSPGFILLADLRRVHRTAAGVSLDWELLAQGAQAARDTALIDLTAHCHPQTLRQMRWANAMLKTLSPQILAS